MPDMPSDEVRFYDPRNGPFRALSNLYHRVLEFEGIHYATPEHAYQAAKPKDAAVRVWIIAAPTPELSAAAGDALQPHEISNGWNETHVPLMERIVRAKFQAPDLRTLLLSTGEAKLVEWSPVDNPVARFWGEFEGKGENTLGRILMRLRQDLR
jgi:N-glycosidase YbiA